MLAKEVMFHGSVVGEERTGITPPLRAAEYPELIKYMGSKSKIIGAVVDALGSVYKGGVICDLFAGSCSLSGALRDRAPIVSNDIQAYSGVLANTYLNAWIDPADCKTAEEIVAKAAILAEEKFARLPVDADYRSIGSLSSFLQIERKSRTLIDCDFDDPFHLFTRYYSGTWWSVSQCVWIDALREVAEQEKSSPAYPAMLASLMFAMAYCSQGTGHYAQYRDADSEKSMADILGYRTKEIKNLFLRKYQQLHDYLPKEPPRFRHVVAAGDYRSCLSMLDEATVYADPPYCFVHYSRFYHALETLVLYDYPKLQERGSGIVKGRYREGRHQSPFCIRSKVSEAFRELFDGIGKSNSNLVLSYSDSGMIPLKEIMAIGEDALGGRYRLATRKLDYKHMTMGRRGDRDRNVKEAIIVAAKK